MHAKVITILNAIGETSMPYNEFILPRTEGKVWDIISFFKICDESLKIPNNIRVYSADGSILRFYELISKVGQTAIGVHLHHPKTAFMYVLYNLYNVKKNRKRILYTVHNVYKNYGLLTKSLLPLIFLHSDYITFVSNESFRSFPGWLKKIVKGKANVVQNAVNISRIAKVLKDVSGEKNDSFEIISIGRLIRQKNHQTLIRAIARLPENIYLTIIGVGSLKEALQSLAKTLGLKERVKFTGLISREEVFRKCARADLFVSSSSWEGLPVAVLEAMACGCSVILSDIPQHREIAGEADFIPLIAPLDADGFSREIAKISNRLYSERLELGDKCKKLVEKRFALNAMHESYDRIYEEVLQC